MCLADSQLSSSICSDTDRGIEKSNIFIKKEQISHDVVEYAFPTIYLIPPYDAGCYIKLYYNGNLLEDTIYISVEGHIISNSDKWKIEKKNKVVNLYQFSIQKHIDNETTTGNICKDVKD